MSGKTGGRRAYDAWWATAEGVPRHPDVTYDQDGAAWEAAAAAGADSAHERVAELVTEVGELRAEVAELRRTIRAEQDLVHADLGEMLEVLGLGDYARPQSPHEVFQQCLAVVRQLREPAVVTAGTEHLAEKIRGLTIPDEES